MYVAGKMTGYAVGIVVGIIIVFILLKYMNRDKMFRTRYDEKQEIARGKGFKVAFFTVIIYDAVMAFITSTFQNIPVNGFVIHFFSVLLGVTVFASYCIWKDAYIGLNTNAPRFYIICLVLGIVNIAISVMNYLNGSLIVDGVWQDSAANICTGLLFVVIGVQLFIKSMIDSKESDAEEE